jgi:hypothetical protein
MDTDTADVPVQDMDTAEELAGVAKDTLPADLHVRIVQEVE